MKRRNRWAFDIPLEGDESYYTVEKLFTMAKAYRQAGNYEDCRILLLRCATEQAALELADLYLNTPQLPLSQQQRWQEAEKILLQLEQQSASAQACRMLGSLYSQTKLPLRSLGFLLRSRRLEGKKLDENTIAYLRTQMLHFEVSCGEQDPRGAGILGYELSFYPQFRPLAVYLLRECVEYADPRGQCALHLAKLLEETGRDDPQDLALSRQYCSIARERGSAPFLHRHAGARRKPSASCNA